MNFVITYFNDVLVAITSVVAAASAVCALTPNTKDDTIVAKIRGILDVLALNVGKAKVVA
ncbi:MAG: hypothetical protein ACI4RJ_00210 [Alphaproteobacteria bacterium]